jgi:mRNA-degrading endonuclease RelE of RelBE toxin-antitoxin system
VAYTIRFDEKTNDHFARLSARQRATVLKKIERQLLHQPTVETRHRKRMQAEKAGFVAPWELRVTGNLRVYYDVEDGPPLTVLIVAVGIKVRNRVRIGDLEIEAS